MMDPFAGMLAIGLETPMPCTVIHAGNRCGTMTKLAFGRSFHTFGLMPWDDTVEMWVIVPVCEGCYHQINNPPTEKDVVFADPMSDVVCDEFDDGFEELEAECSYRQGEEE